MTGGGTGRVTDVRILVVEDDRQTLDYVVGGLKEHGHVVDAAEDGQDGLFMAMNNAYDVLVLDRMLPRLDGLSLAKTLRMSGNLTPVLFLTAMGSIQDRVDGLTVGDDYLVKPFAFAELMARVQALYRRPSAMQEVTALHVADLTMDLLKHRVSRGGRSISLQPQEFKLLEFMLRHKGEVVTRTMLLEGVWDFHFDPKTNIVETHISRLRAKLGEPALIHTQRGVGYRCDAG